MPHSLHTLAHGHELAALSSPGLKWLISNISYSLKEGLFSLYMSRCHSFTSGVAERHARRAPAYVHSRYARLYCFLALWLLAGLCRSQRVWHIARHKRGKQNSHPGVAGQACTLFVVAGADGNSGMKENVCAVTRLAAKQVLPYIILK